jgi:hypothetical protein
MTLPHAKPHGCDQTVRHDSQWIRAVVVTDTVAPIPPSHPHFTDRKRPHMARVGQDSLAVIAVLECPQTGMRSENYLAVKLSLGQYPYSIQVARSDIIRARNPRSVPRAQQRIVSKNDLREHAAEPNTGIIGW